LLRPQSESDHEHKFCVLGPFSAALFGYGAEQLAAAEHVPGKMVAKTIVTKADDRFVMAVRSASARIDLPALREQLQARQLRLATESEFQELFPDSDVGAMPPFGNLYEVPVYAERSLADDEKTARPMKDGAVENTLLTTPRRGAL
jgi:prolyl-tRNA editing enzyme YbaK/EbsC (Cys-tRNA(Pro) deacylase)